MNFVFAQIGAKTSRMNARPPQALVRINVAHPSQHALIQQQCFDVRPPRTNHCAEFFLGCFQRIKPQLAQHALIRRISEHCHSSKPANIGVTKFAAIIEPEKHVRVRRYGNFRRTSNDLPGHA